MNTGLAIGGGAIRALSSLGVIDHLNQHGFMPTRIAGTSMGAVIGAFVAAGYSVEEIAAIARQRHFMKFIRPNLKLGNLNGFFSLDPFAQYLSTLLPKTFDKLETPLTVVATDIDTASPVLMSSGDLIEAVIASCSIPLLFKPAVINSQYLVDGGLVEQLPISPLVAAGCDCIVGIWSGYIAKNKPKYRGIIDIGTRAIDILGKNMYKIAASYPEVCIVSPDIEKYSLFSFKNLESIIEEGRTAAKTNAELERILTPPPATRRVR